MQNSHFYSRLLAFILAAGFGSASYGMEQDRKDAYNKSLEEYQKRRDLENEFVHTAKKGNYEKLKELIQHGADVNSQDRYGDTALMYAAYQENTEIIELLLNRGADLEIRNVYAHTALANM